METRITSVIINYFRKSYSTKQAIALRSTKKRSTKYAKEFVDVRMVQASAGNGGNGCISFLQAFAQEFGGPDGGDGGNGGHVLFEASVDIKGLGHIHPLVKAEHGEKGYNKDCNGKNATHKVVKVPLGTVVKNSEGVVIADLHKEKMMFIAARGGAGGRGNRFFATALNSAPQIAELGAEGERFKYKLELSSIANFGLLGFPNTGKSTLLKSITRANPKVAPYPFTTLKPHLGVVRYNDLEQITIADLPGLIEGSHKNNGLGISFLRHAERCMGLLMVLDMTESNPWNFLHILRNEILCFSKGLSSRPQIIVANKMDVAEAEKTLSELKKRLPDETIVPISAKHGLNLSQLLSTIRCLYDEQMLKKKEQIDKDAQHVENGL